MTDTNINRWSHVIVPVSQQPTPSPHIRTLPFTLRPIRQFGDIIMSDSDPPTQLTKDQAASLLGPGITGLFIQGIETGLVLAELSWWFSSSRRERHIVSVIVIFVTVVGLYVFPRL
jgi:hypothetical protein